MTRDEKIIKKADKLILKETGLPASALPKLRQDPHYAFLYLYFSFEDLSKTFRRELNKLKFTHKELRAVKINEIKVPPSYDAEASYMPEQKVSYFKLKLKK